MSGGSGGAVNEGFIAAAWIRLVAREGRRAAPSLEGVRPEVRGWLLGLGDDDVAALYLTLTLYQRRMADVLGGRCAPDGGPGNGLPPWMRRRRAPPPGPPPARPPARAAGAAPARAGLPALRDPVGVPSAPRPAPPVVDAEFAAVRDGALPSPLFRVDEAEGAAAAGLSRSYEPLYQEALAVGDFGRAALLYDEFAERRAAIAAFEAMMADPGRREAYLAALRPLR